MLQEGSGDGACAAAPAERERVATAAKSFERALQCVLAALNKQPVGFARFLPAFLAFYGHAALVALDAAALQHVRPKTRVLLTRFLARVLLCPYYTRSWLEGRTAQGIAPVTRFLPLAVSGCSARTTSAHGSKAVRHKVFLLSQSSSRLLCQRCLSELDTGDFAENAWVSSLVSLVILSLRAVRAALIINACNLHRAPLPVSGPLKAQHMLLFGPGIRFICYIHQHL